MLLTYEKWNNAWIQFVHNPKIGLCTNWEDWRICPASENALSTLLSTMCDILRWRTAEFTRGACHWLLSAKYCDPEEISPLTLQMSAIKASTVSKGTPAWFQISHVPVGRPLPSASPGREKTSSAPDRDDPRYNTVNDAVQERKRNTQRNLFSNMKAMIEQHRKCSFPM